MLTTVNETELKDILSLTPSDQNIMITGKHGIGKSVIVKNFFENQGKKVITMFCSQAADPGDIIGLPRYNEVTGKTEFALPWWFPTDNTPVILFLDELNRARPEILQVVMDLTLSRKLAGKSLPEGSQIISAINEGDEYQLTDLDPALVSRFNVYNFVPTPNDWIMWATNSGIDQRIISFITTNVKYLDSNFGEDSTTLDKTPDRRAWERVSDIMKLNPEINLSFKKMISGIIGGSAAVSFYESLIKNTLVTPEKLLGNFDNVKKLLKKYTLQQFIYLNDSLCSFINTSIDEVGTNTVLEDMYAKSLVEYFNFLQDPAFGNKEAFAHFINNYETGTFCNVNFIVASHPELEDTICNFIVSTGNKNEQK